ncbi:hypothetical protein [Clostridium sp.]|nr:hypothetical protein [Clostridium sp.]
MDSNYIKEMAYSLGADVCGIGSIKRFNDAPGELVMKNVMKF